MNISGFSELVMGGLSALQLWWGSFHDSSGQ